MDTIACEADELWYVAVFNPDFIGALTPFLDPGSISSGEVSIVVDGAEMKAPTVSPAVDRQSSKVKASPRGMSSWRPSITQWKPRTPANVAMLVLCLTRKGT
jgi:hypothetical protein